MKYQQPSLWETFFPEEVADLCEPWMREVDELLEDDELVGGVYDAQGRGVPRAARADGIRRPPRSH